VILLMLLGWVIKLGTEYFSIHLPDLSTILPTLGTIGLILIVLEGALELEMNKSKFKVIRSSSLGALLSIMASAFALAWMFSYFGGYSLKQSLINAIPFCVISSAVAIPSAKHLNPKLREFVIYESSLSDILGVLFFNFLAINEILNWYSFGHFGLQLVIISVISFIATIGLSFLLSKIEHQIKFVPIILLIILIYAISEIYHLPALIFILLFGLVIGNLDELKRFRWIEKFKPDILNKEVQKFKELTIEGAFLVRAAFFLLFGYLLETEEILNPATPIWALAIVLIILVVRAIQLIASGLPLNPLLFVAPRGLITILLFLSISSSQVISLVNKSLVIQVIIFTSLLMMIGLMVAGSKKNDGVTNGAKRESQQKSETDPSPVNPTGDLNTNGDMSSKKTTLPADNNGGESISPML
jgi:hypothetical protein